MAQWESRELNSITPLWSMYQQGIDYQNSKGIRYNIPKYVDFYEGRQWPLPTESTKNLPRPVINIIKMICRSKKSSILSTPVKIAYKSYSCGTDVEKLNDFAQYVLNELGQDSLDRLAIDDGIKKGSYFYHYYWDKYARGLGGQLEGSVRCELIDPLNIFFSDPSQLDEQKQDWILIASKRKMQDIVSLSHNNITVSDLESEGEEKGSKDDKKITLLTRYFRINGEVYCERATKSVIVCPPFKICPDTAYLSSLINNKEENAPKCKDSSLNTQNSSISRDIKEFLDFNNNFKPVASLYPVVCGYYDRREGSIYGLSEVEGLIPNQKSINFNIAMSLLNAQQCAWGKYIALPNALKGQKISNTPGQVLIDHSGTGEGIKRMKEESVSQVPLTLTETIAQLTRACAGATEIFSNEATASNMSGVAIAQLQMQALVPIEELKSNFWEVKRKQGNVLSQFLRLYYYEKEFIRKKAEKDGKETSYYDSFSSVDYENSILEVTVEPVRGVNASIASDISMLDSCLKNGSISFETYINAYPDSALSNKKAILRQIEAEKQSEITLLRKELEKYKKSKTSDPVSIV